eukprot:6945529-Pyramimonas_sp.AAC.2
MQGALSTHPSSPDWRDPSTRTHSGHRTCHRWAGCRWRRKGSDNDDEEKGSGEGKKVDGGFPRGGGGRGDDNDKGATTNTTTTIRERTRDASHTRGGACV